MAAKKKNPAIKKKKTQRRPQTEEARKRQMAGLVMWKKGQSGNPKGRPPGRNMSAHMRELMDCNCANVPHLARIVRDDFDLEPSGFTVGEFLAYQLMMSIVNTADPRKLEMLLDRVEGKVTQKIEQELLASVNSMSASIDELDLPLETRKKILQAMKKQAEDAAE